jgi:O-antigen/teichoic acid export membrane protein
LSIKKRFLFSVGANIARAAVSLVVGLLVARGLGPVDYGNLAYLLGSFLAIRALFDMGASSAFYTFIASRNQWGNYYLIYFYWLGFQFLLSVVLVVLLLPSAVIERFWLGQDRFMILLALLATFLQNQVWQTIVQMHEAVRKTIRVQVAGVLIILAHLLIVTLMLAGDWLSVETIFISIIVEHLVAAVWLSVSFRKMNSFQGSDEMNAADESSLKYVLYAYIRYCRPLIIIAIFSFCYGMVDRWLLQRFGGAGQQGFYQVASQLSTISLLATTSILNILWKEIAEASECGEHARVAALHQKTSRLLVGLASVVSCFLAPWADQLVDVLLGNAYHAAWPVLYLMLFYPIHQTVGQVNSALFMASGQNSVYMKITVTGLLVSIPVSYVLIAPPDAPVLPGLGLGAMGLALKIVGLNILFVSIQSWVIARRYGVKLQWRYQVGLIPGLLAVGYACRSAVEILAPHISQLESVSAKSEVMIEIVLGGLIYAFVVLAIFIRMPDMAGMQRSEVADLQKRLKLLLYRTG